MKSYIDIVKEIKDLSKSRITDIRKGMLAGHMCRPLSPYLSAIFINWGLDVSAVKDVSVARNDRKELDKIVSIVLSIKSIHLLLSAFLLFASFFFIPYVHENIWLLLCCFLLCFTDVLFPIWFYQGIEKMKYLALIRFISIFFYTISIFIFIR